MPNEIVIVDKIAERVARASLGPDAETLGYVLTNIRVSQLGEMKIIRMDLYDNKIKGNVGIAIRTETKDEIDEAINLFGN